MCGITGYITPASFSPPSPVSEVIRAMTDAISHRGPDDSGIWVEQSLPLALGHRRLSIVDLSPLGHQPMRSHSGRFVTVFNGEIYNFLELKEQLGSEARFLRGGSDTEVLLLGFEVWGIQDTLRRANGMFALAIWDSEASTLTLARDRVGKKPLYYGWTGRGELLLGSELKAILAVPHAKFRVCQSALAAFLRFGYVPDPFSILEGIYKLPPGHLLTLTKEVLNTGRPATFSEGMEWLWDAGSTLGSGSHVAPEPFWDLREKIGSAENLLAEQDRLQYLSDLLDDAVRIRMIADVPLGAFLSGGIDSSLVVARMVKNSAQKVRTFSIGFDDPAFDESAYARQVAVHLGTEHEEFHVTGRECLDVVPQLPAFYDEPFADASQIPTYLVSSMARKHVTVVLTGEGGDELFLGYNRYQQLPLALRLASLPTALRATVAKSARQLSSHPALLGWMKALPERYQLKRPQEVVAKMVALAEAADRESVYQALLSLSPDGAYRSLLSGPHGPTLRREWLSAITDAAEYASSLDAALYLPGDVLQKADRASMAVALEARCPLLDYRIIEFAFRLPSSIRMAHGERKALLKRLLERHLPHSLIERPKMGFSVPLAGWLRGPLREWASELLSEREIASHGLLNAVAVRQLWDQHIGGSVNRASVLWAVAMFQAWYRAYRHRLE